MSVLEISELSYRYKNSRENILLDVNQTFELGQFIIELLLISLPAVILSIAVGNVLFKFIINELLKREYSLLVTNGIEQELSAFLASYGILVTVICC